MFFKHLFVWKCFSWELLWSEEIWAHKLFNFQKFRWCTGSWNESVRLIKFEIEKNQEISTHMIFSRHIQALGRRTGAFRGHLNPKLPNGQVVTVASIFLAVEEYLPSISAQDYKGLYKEEAPKVSEKRARTQTQISINNYCRDFKLFILISLKFSLKF